jgi:hypothetical protein
LKCIFLDHPDTALNEYGARGLGEIGLTGVAPALAMAVYHASGVRVRELPIQSKIYCKLPHKSIVYFAKRRALRGKFGMQGSFAFVNSGSDEDPSVRLSCNLT